MFNCSPVYYANRQSKADIVVNQGGTDSTKTYSIIQLLTEIAATTKAPLSDPIITILSESVPNSKKGAYRTFQAIITGSDYAYEQIRNWNATDRTITFKTGWIMEFVGATDEQNAKQGKRQYLFANEANGIPWPIFWQMAKRTRIRTFIDYNPSAPFWAHEKLIGTTPTTNDLSATVQLIISDHRHNPFIDQAQHDKTENIKDPELWAVYARGKTGNLSGLIYPNWRQIEEKDFPWDAPKFGGLDFGYTNDPTAGIRACKIADNIYVHELCYTPGLTANQIFALYKAEKFRDEDPVYCEHDNGMIRELRMKDPGILALPARKGPNSIAPGIAKVKEYNVFYTASSKNIHMERQKYMWQKDPINGKFINVPSEADNHLMDAIRYAISTHFYRSPN
jgi:phage terminase large subunit